MNYISQQEPNQMWIKKVLMLVLADILIVLISYFMALLLRFDFVFSSIPEEYLMGYLWSMPFWIISTIVIFYICRLYHSIWRLASVAELQMILIAYSILAVVYSLGMLFMQMHMPRSYYFIGFLLNFLMTTGLRFSYRLMRFWVNSRNTNADTGGEMHAKDHVMVIGAGAAGQALIKEIINSKKLNTQVVCIIDDNPTKHGRVLEGITIVGDRYSIPEMAKKYKVDRIIYAIPEAAADDRKAILNICKDTGCRLQTVPGVYQLVNGEVSVSRLRNVEITDLLGRAQVQVNMDEIYSSIQGKTLLVTGGGGSIGSELCRQIAASHPKKLIIFDMYENNAYEIQQELRRKYGDSLDLEVLIGSVRNTNRIRSIMQKYKPDVVFHAAAHKHVPLMEDSPNEAIKNNVMGTYKTAVAASRAGVKKFVLISTDKAVNPTNIMGASKRLCEMVVQMMNRQCKDTDFVAVRFGNVLGSNGSVIPLFKKQIAEGGPVTVTDKNIIRYFMTIPEAVSLVLQAAHYAKGGEIFILDMGEPVRIDEMARNLIRLSGFTPDVDIKVEYTGLRPGEKLFEELLMAEEGMQETPNKLKNNGLSYDLEYAGAEDYNLWWKIAKVSRIATIPDLLVKYRIHSSQITKKKDEKYYKMMKKLMEERFSDIGFKSSDIEKKVFMKYCLGEYETFSQKEVEELVDCLVHLLRCNKSNKYFSQKKLIKIFELAIIYTLNNSRLSDVEKKQSYKYAVKAGAFTLVTIAILLNNAISLQG